MTARRILAPIDFTSASRRALAYAVQMAQAEGAKLTILHVADMPQYVSPSLAVMVAEGTSPISIEALTRTQATSKMRATLIEAGIDRDQCEVEVTLGDPLTVILDQIPRYDLAVLGTHARHGLDHLFIGSVAEKVVRSARRPIVIVRSGIERAAEFPPKRILVPLDFSDGARHAFELAHDLAERHGATVSLVHVIEDFPEFEGPEQLVVVAAGEEPQSYVEHAQARVMEALRLFVTGRFEGTLPNLEVVIGSAHRELVAFAERSDADLVVMGTHGRTGIRRIGIGSVAERVVRTSTVPVMTARE